MSRRHRWELSSSNLRICLKLFQAHRFRSSETVGQFQWVQFLNTFYLYNTRSEIILATLKYTQNSTFFIRYRVKSRYREIVQRWAEGLTVEGMRVVAIPSPHISRWERRMRYSRNHDNSSRSLAIERYCCDVARLPGEVPIADRLRGGSEVPIARNRAHRSNPTDNLAAANSSLRRTLESRIAEASLWASRRPEINTEPEPGRPYFIFNDPPETSQDTEAHETDEAQ